MMDVVFYLRDMHGNQSPRQTWTLACLPRVGDSLLRKSIAYKVLEVIFDLDEREYQIIAQEIS